MTTDITYCLSHQCSAKDTCKRYLTETEAYELTMRKVPLNLTFADFEPEKGIDCKGFRKKAKLTLSPLEDK